MLSRLNSVVGTYRLKGVAPDRWIKATFEEIASGGPTSDIDARLHWNFPKAANTALAQL